MKKWVFLSPPLGPTTRFLEISARQVWGEPGEGVAAEESASQLQAGTVEVFAAALGREKKTVDMFFETISDLISSPD